MSKKDSYSTRTGRIHVAFSSADGLGFLRCYYTSISIQNHNEHYSFLEPI